MCACDFCRELRAAMLFVLGPIRLPPPELRARILRLCADTTPEGAEKRTHVARRAEPFAHTTGFPLRLDATPEPDSHSHPDSGPDPDPD